MCGGMSTEHLFQTGVCWGGMKHLRTHSKSGVVSLNQGWIHRGCVEGVWVSTEHPLQTGGCVGVSTEHPFQSGGCYCWGGMKDLRINSKPGIVLLNQRWIYRWCVGGGVGVTTEHPLQTGGGGG